MYTRYAIYFTPEAALAKAGAAWLGWDVATGQAVRQPKIDGVDLPALTATPRKYGFHATLKPPFVMADDKTVDRLLHALHVFCKTNASVICEGLAVSQMGRFFALTPIGDVTSLNALASGIVTAFDEFRAPPSAAELERRRKAGLSVAQERNLVDWGYPHVMDQFRFHMTLTGRVKDTDGVVAVLSRQFDPVLPVPFHLDHLTLAGEREDGMFEEIARVPLADC